MTALLRMAGLKALAFDEMLQVKRFRWLCTMARIMIEALHTPRFFSRTVIFQKRVTQIIPITLIIITSLVPISNRSCKFNQVRKDFNSRMHIIDSILKVPLISRFHSKAVQNKPLVND